MFMVIHGKLKIHQSYYISYIYDSLGNAPNEMMDGVLRDFLPDLEQGVTELLDSLRCKLRESDWPKHNVPEVSHWI